MFTKILAGVVPAIVISLSGLSFAGPLEDRVAAGKPIRLGFADAAPWANPGSNGEPQGFVNVITLDVLKKMGYNNIETVVTDWAGLIPSLMAGRVDIVTGGMYITHERCENMDFSEPIGKFGNAFIVPKGNPLNLQNYEDIKKSGVTMAAVAGYVMGDEALKSGVPEEKIMLLPSVTEVLAAVKSGRAAAGALTAVEAHDLAIKTDGISDTDTNALPEWTFNWVGVGFNPDDDAFRAEFNKNLRDGYLGSKQMLQDVAQYGYLPVNVPDDTKTEWACANR